MARFEKGENNGKRAKQKRDDRPPQKEHKCTLPISASGFDITNNELLLELSVLDAEGLPYTAVITVTDVNAGKQLAKALGLDPEQLRLDN